MRRSFGVLTLAVWLSIGCASQPVPAEPSTLAASNVPASRPPMSTPTPTAPPSPTADQLLAALRDPTSAETRAMAAESLASVRDPAVVPALVGALADADASVRIAAAVSLGSLGGTVGAKALAAALQSELKAEPSSAFVAAACGALGQTGSTAGVAVLITRFWATPTRRTVTPRARR